MSWEDSSSKVRALSSLHEENTRRTPDQPTQPKDPNFTGEADESTAEDNTKEMIKLFIRITLSLFSKGIAQVTWPRFAGACHLRVDAYVFSLLTSYRRHEQMNFRLKNKMVAAENDGGIIIRNPERIWRLMDSKCTIKSVVSIEVRCIVIDH